MNKKVKFIAHLKINCNYDDNIEFENDEEFYWICWTYHMKHI